MNEQQDSQMEADAARLGLPRREREFAQDTDWLAIADSLGVPLDPEQERRQWAAQATWATHNTRAIMAVTQALGEDEHELMLRQVVQAHPQLRGIGVADWLEMADNRDWFVRESEVTLDQWGRALVEQTGPQVATVVHLATIAAATMYPGEQDTLVHVAQRIALDTLESLGV